MKKLTLNVLGCTLILAFIGYMAKHRPDTRQTASLPLNERFQTSQAVGLVSSIHRQAADAPAWAIRYGQEFWRKPAPAPPGADGDLKAPASFNPTEVARRVSHAITQEAGAPYPQSHSRFYTASFDGEGFRLRPKQNSSATSAGSSDALQTAATAPSSPASADEGVFRTKRVQRAGEDLFVEGQTKPWALVGNTAQALLNEQRGLVEHFETHPQGIEVTWIVKHRSPSSGPIDIEAQLEGYRHRASDADGHHFVSVNGQAGIRVSDVTLVDATGAKQELPMLVANNSLRVHVPADWLDHATFPIAIDPMVGPDDLLDITLQPDAQADADVASNGENYLVVWVDGRNAQLETRQSEDVYGARVSLTGEVLDVGGIAIGRALELQYEPAVASDGDRYLVVWGETRNDVDEPSNNWDIYGAIVASDGSTAGDGFPICTETHPQEHPAVASNGGGFLVVWHDRRYIENVQPNAIYGARVSATAGVLDPDGFMIAPEDPAGQFLSYPKVASDGLNYLVVWNDLDLGLCTVAVQGAQVLASGAVGGSFLIQDKATGGNVAYSPFAAKYLVVYYDYGSADPCNPIQPGLGIYGKRIAVAGGGVNLLDGNGFAIGQGALPTRSHTGNIVDLACNGDTFLVTWADVSISSIPKIVATRVRASDATVLDPNPILISDHEHQSGPAVAASGEEFLVVWQIGELDDTPQAAIDIYAARVTAAGQVFDVFPVSISDVVSVHRLNEEFSVESNPSSGSPWSFGYAENLDGSFTPVTYPYESPADDGTLIPSWQLDWGRSPAFYYNNSGHAVTVGGGAITCQSGDVWFVPGDDGYPENYGVIRYTVPAGEAGIYQVLSRVQSFYVDWTWTGDTDFHVLRNGVEIYGNYLPGGGSAGFTRTLNLATSDTIDFVIGRGADESQYASVLKIWATLQKVAPSGTPGASTSPNTDFSLNSNPLPGGRWSLGYSEGLGSGFTLDAFPYGDSAADDGTLVPSWQLDWGRSPVFYCNTSDHTITAGWGACTFVPRTIWFYPGDDGYPENYGVIRFTVPAGQGGTYSVGAVIESVYLFMGSGDTDFHILKNGVELEGQDVAAGGAGMFGKKLQLATGDTIDFVVGRGADGSQYASGLKLWAEVTRLP